MTSPLFRRPSLGRAAASSAGSSAAAAATRHHTFVWDLALRQQLEGAAIGHFPQRDKSDNARVAKENWRLVEQGHYVDTAGKQHSLKLPPSAINRTHQAPPSAGRPLAPRHERTSVCVARLDTATALRVMHTLGARKCAALNFANAYHPGGGYLNGARAQEEDLCRLIPTLFTSLKRLRYPLKEHAAHYTQGWLSRTAGSYQLEARPLLVDVVSAAMPDLGRGRLAGRMRAGSLPWEATVRLRMRAVLHAAREEGCDSLILGAFGCGAFGNPPELVAPLFAEALASDEFRGAFSSVVFAILEFRDADSGNVASFVRACGAEPGGLCAPPAAAAEAEAAALALPGSSQDDPMDVS